MSEPRRLEPSVWEIPVGYVEGMRVPGIVFANDELFAKAVEDRAVEQVANVATLPGIVGASYAMPDIHWGYGFPIGGVAATDVAAGGGGPPGGGGLDTRRGGGPPPPPPRPGCRPAPASAGPASWAASAAATTSWRSRSWTRSATPPPGPPWG